MLLTASCQLTVLLCPIYIFTLNVLHELITNASPPPAALLLVATKICFNYLCCNFPITLLSVSGLQTIELGCDVL